MELPPSSEDLTDPFERVFGIFFVRTSQRVQFAPIIGCASCAICCFLHGIQIKMMDAKLSNNSETEEITMVCVTMALDLKAKKLGLVRPIR
jgi:hypothetical protein